MFCTFEQYARGAEAQSVLYQEQNTLRDEQKRDILARIKAVRELLEQLRDDLGLAPETQDIARAIWAMSSAFWVALVELDSGHLRRYGDVPPGLAQYLDPKVDALIQHVTAISEIVSGGPNPSRGCGRTGGPRKGKGR